MHLVKADRGSPVGKPSRKPGAALRVAVLADSGAYQRTAWLTLEEAQVLLGDLTKVVREIEAERIADREKARAAQ